MSLNVYFNISSSFESKLGIGQNQPEFNFNPALINDKEKSGNLKVVPVPFSDEEMKQAQHTTGVYKDLIKGSDGIWYIKNPNGTLGENAIQWKSDSGSLYNDDDSGVRRDFR